MINPPVKTKFEEERVTEFLADWRDWKRQTAGKRIRCQRHHLGQRLTHFEEGDITLVITLARIGDAGVAVPFSAGYAETNNYLEGVAVEDVIFEYYGRFENLVLEGMRLVQAHEQACRNQMPPQTDDGGGEMAA